MSKVTKEKYINSWKSHVAELNTLRWSFIGEYPEIDKEIQDIQHRLYEIIEKAAEIEDFEE